MGSAADKVFEKSKGSKSDRLTSSSANLHTKNSKTHLKTLHPFSIEAITNFKSPDSPENLLKQKKECRLFYKKKSEKSPGSSPESRFVSEKSESQGAEKLNKNLHPLDLLQNRILDRLDQTFPEGRLRFLDDHVNITDPALPNNQLSKATNSVEHNRKRKLSDGKIWGHHSDFCRNDGTQYKKSVKSYKNFNPTKRAEKTKVLLSNCFAKKPYCWTKDLNSNTALFNQCHNLYRSSSE